MKWTQSSVIVAGKIAAVCTAIAAASIPAHAQDGDGEDDRPPVTYTEHVQPLLRDKCGTCHGGVGHSYAPPFAESYAETQILSGRYQTRCPGKSVGACIGDAVAIQEGHGHSCRTFHQPFHRESFTCLDESEKTLLALWVADGQRE